MKKKILEGYSQQIFKRKYSHYKDEEWWQRSSVVTHHSAKAELPANRERYIKEVTPLINDLDFVPGGRIVFSAGRIKASGMNCFALSVDDSRESIGKLFADFMIISSSGGGVGINFSNLRPKGDPILSIGGETSGVLSWIHVINSMGDVIRAGGSRRMACLACLSISHPEILEFINAKSGEENKLKFNNINFSVLLNNKFIQAVKDRTSFPLSFRGKVYKEIDARKTWEIICKNALLSGEPGILHEDNFREGNNLEYCMPFVTTNPCGEVALSNAESCCLGSVNLSHFSRKNKDNEVVVDTRKLKKTIRLAVRFLDNIIDVNDFPTPETEQASKEGRRIGLGVMGLHHLLIKLDLAYGASEKTVEFLDWLNTLLRNEAYRASVDLAIEKGPFEKFDPDLYLKNAFIKRLPRSIKNNIKKHGIRNAAILTVPPTGTTSMIAGTSSGLEPIFALAYTRRVIIDGEDNYKEEMLVDPFVKELIQEGVSFEKISKIKTAHDLSPQDHLQIQQVYQDYIDNSISKTIFLPSDFKDETLPDLLLEYIDDIKGLTLYKDKSRENQPLQPVPFTLELYNKIKTNKNISVLNEESQTNACKNGQCEI